MGTVTGDLKQESAGAERTEQIDFKMVTFTLGGKDYGIDIMKVKEISKDSYFTYVPNSAPFVRGVYNLRGDIISIIDLRIMFHLPAPEKEEGELENMIILRLKDHILGVIVDSIDKVIGISSANIQPTHPLFGDINIKYISGVVEHGNRLYIILDAEKIFGKEAAGQEKEKATEYQKEAVEAEPRYKAIDQGELDFNFIAETLSTFKNFYVTDINEGWVKRRFTEWEAQKRSEGKGLQLQSPDDAEGFLATFYSPYTGSLLGEEYLINLKNITSTLQSKSITAWNPGCGKGFETFSLACLLRKTFPDRRIKIWANDNDLLNISTAPSLVFNKEEVPSLLQEFLVEGKNGYQFNTEIKDLILFEYHDILNLNPLPEVDIILARDVISFQKPAEQWKILKEFEGKLKGNGLLFIGENEKVGGDNWTVLEGGRVVAYKLKND
ncbi:MAG: CheR family methyltransferase [Spirochaetota bacterium]